MNDSGILFVCLGNICRSPTAEAVARAEFSHAGLHVAVASCGTGSWHVGEGADPRTIRAGAAAGYDLTPHRARQLQPDDFERHQLVLAMDEANRRDLMRLCPPRLHDRIGLFLQVSSAAPPAEVPDPYEGTSEDFAYVVSLVQRGVQGLARYLQG